MELIKHVLKISFKCIQNMVAKVGKDSELEFQYLFIKKKISHEKLQFLLSVTLYRDPQINKMKCLTFGSRQTLYMMNLVYMSVSWDRKERTSRLFKRLYGEQINRQIYL